MATTTEGEKIDKILEGIKTIAPFLPKHEAEILRFALQHARNLRDFAHIRDRIKEPNIRKCPKVSMDTFLDDPHYLGIGSMVYPKVREICREVVDGGYTEGVEVAGIGAGKSFSSEIIVCYYAHHLLCLRNAHFRYGLSPDKNIAIINMGISATQALDVVFSGIRGLIEKTPFFLQFQPRILNGSIEFYENKLLMLSGNSKSTTPLGYNVFCAILDEAAFYLDNEHRSVAQEIYESLQRRIVSRFGKEGLLMMISSPRYIEDFIMRKLDESKLLNPDGTKVNPHIYSVQLPTWKVKAKKGTDATSKFLFNQRTGAILAEEELAGAYGTYRVNTLEQEDFDDTFDVWEIPGEYISSFRQNPEKAKRDFGATPSLTLQGFFPSPQILMDTYNKERKNPVIAPGMYRFAERPLRLPYFLHVDIGLNRDGFGDHTGLAMGHFGGWQTDEATGEIRMKFIIDFVERIGALDGKGEVDLAGIRNRLYELKSMGFQIRLVTLDGYQSKDTMQIFQKKGIKAAYLSVDRTIDAYNALKEAFYEKRIDIPYYEPLDKELCRLELIKGIKVDHPPGGSKDCADAVAGVVFNIMSNTANSDLSIRVGGDYSNENLALRQHREQQQKERQIQTAQRMLDRQDTIMSKLGF